MLGSFGNANFSGGSTYVGTLDTGVWPGPDPASVLIAPTWNPADDLGTASFSGGVGAVNPGYYSGGIEITGGADVTLEPGPYILGGQGLTVSGSSVTGYGVVLYITGTGKLTLSGMGLQIRGAIYAPSALISISGDGGPTGPLLGSFLVAAEVDVSGDGRISIGTATAPIPSLGAFD